MCVISASASSMASILQLLPILSLHWLIINTVFISSNQTPEPYVVYMGSSSSSNGDIHDVEVSNLAHLQLLSSIIPSDESERIKLIHHYNHAFKGFSAMLTDKEASALSGKGEVVSVFRDPILQLHTTRSWDFLEQQPNTSSVYNHQHNDVIIGIIDTGIWPESQSFKDIGLGEIPSRWNGVCMESHDFKKSHCNRKLIGARYYPTTHSSSSNSSKMTSGGGGSPRDPIGHGTHVASTAAGSHVANVSYGGLAGGTARGGSPSSRIASYKACTEDGCSGSTILKAMEDAIRDGVDMISISIGMSAIFQEDFLSDPIAIGAFHAEQLGVMVVCSAGNDGPDSSTVVNTAPWILTVAASTIDRDFKSNVLLGNGKTLQGSGIHFSNISGSRTYYPLAFAEDVAARLTPLQEARSCYPGSLDPEKVEGKIIVCIENDQSVPRKIMKLVVEDSKAKGLILVNEDEKGVPFDSGIFAFAQVDNIIGSQIISYINSTKKPTATILPTVDVLKHRPAPVIAYFSSRGPGQLTDNILKPDITAPGVAILAAVVPRDTDRTVPIGQKPPNFATRSGTSMACPHVTGAAAFIRSVHNQWTSSMIKSALMTTATVYDNLGKPMRSNTGYRANPHEMGAGEISPFKALNPGLVFETTPEDHFKFLCYYGYPDKTIRSMIISNKKNSFNCPKNSTEKLISNINYPSISIADLDQRRGVRTIRRTVTNVGSSPNATYIVRVHAPSGLLVKVVPEKLGFSDSVKRVSFKVAFYSKKEASSGYKFGSITLLDGLHSVRMVFAVNVQ